MALHLLTKLVSGAYHLVKSAGGHLQATSDPSGCSCCGTNCPGDCTSCPTTAFTLTIAGATAGFGGFFCCAAMNGVWTLTGPAYNGTHCSWGYTTGVVAVCPGGFTTIMTFILFCDTHDCTGAVAAKRWVIIGQGSNTFRAEMISNANCPPTGNYNIVCNTGCGSVIGNTLTVVLS